MQRTRFILDGAVYLRRRLSQLSPRISARLPQWREAVGVGPDEMVDLDSIETGLDERSASRAAGSNLLQTSAASEISGRLIPVVSDDIVPFAGGGPSFAWR